MPISTYGKKIEADYALNKSLNIASEHHISSVHYCLVKEECVGLEYSSMCAFQNWI